MAEGRVKTQDFDPSIYYRPAASPVDTFVRPAEDLGTKSLVTALAELQPQLGKYLQEHREEKKLEDIDAGRAAALKSALEWGDAVAQGKVDPHQSKWFIKAYNEQYGRLLGAKLRAQAEFEWSNSPLLASGDPAAIDPFLAKFRQESIGGITDPDVLAGLAPVIEGAVADLQTFHVRRQAEVIREKAVQGYGAEIVNAVDSAYRLELQDGQWSDAGLIDAIGVLEAAAKVQGIAPADVNDLLIQVLTNKAVEEGDTRVLKVLENHRGDLSAGRTIKGREAISIAESRILQDQAARATKANAAANAARQAELDSLSSSIALEYQMATEAGREFIPDPAMMGRLAVLDFRTYSSVVSFVKSYGDDAIEVDALEMRGIQQELIANGGNLTPIMDQIAKLPDSQKAEIVKFADGITEWNPGNDPTYNRIYGSIQSLYKTTDINGVPIGGLEQNFDIGANALQEFNRRVWELVTDRPELLKDAAARDQAMFELWDSIRAEFPAVNLFKQPDAPAQTGETTK